MPSQAELNARNRRRVQALAARGVHEADIACEVRISLALVRAYRKPAAAPMVVVPIEDAPAVAPVRDIWFLASVGFDEDHEAEAIADGIIRNAAARHGVSVAEIMNGTRRVPVKEARWDAVLGLVRSLPGWTLVQIARRMRLDHTSVLHICKKRGIVHGRDIPIAFRAKLKLAA